VREPARDGASPPGRQSPCLFHVCLGRKVALHRDWHMSELHLNRTPHVLRANRYSQTPSTLPPQRRGDLADYSLSQHVVAFRREMYPVGLVGQPAQHAVWQEDDLMPIALNLLSMADDWSGERCLRSFPPG